MDLREHGSVPCGTNTLDDACKCLPKDGSPNRVEKVEEYLKIGDLIDVKYVGFDPRTKKQKVSRRMLLERPPKKDN